MEVTSMTDEEIASAIRMSRYSRSVSPKTRKFPVARERHASSYDSDDDDESSGGGTPAVSPYRPFPPYMNVFCSWAAAKTLRVCGAGRDERLYAVDVHTGLGGRKPLGTRPGLILRNGARGAQDPVLAAACDESQMAARFYAFNLNSVILLPPLSSKSKAAAAAVAAAGPKDLVAETMRARTLGDRGFAFRFAVEVGRRGGVERLQRVQFEWRSVGKGEDGEAREGGFKLVQVAPERREGRRGRSGSSSSQTETDDDDDNSEVLALLSWTKTWWLTHPFALQLKGSGQSGALGERWTLAVVVTALRIWVLRLNFRSNRGIISLAETIRGK
ncbi:hypothetical protein Hte_008897 [Hypoxylon texense]